MGGGEFYHDAVEQENHRFLKSTSIKMASNKKAAIQALPPLAVDDALNAKQPVQGVNVLNNVRADAQLMHDKIKALQKHTKHRY